jgi:hypothetical protein
MGISSTVYKLAATTMSLLMAFDTSSGFFFGKKNGISNYDGSFFEITQRFVEFAVYIGE